MGEAPKVVPLQPLPAADQMSVRQLMKYPRMPGTNGLFRYEPLMDPGRPLIAAADVLAALPVERLSMFVDDNSGSPITWG